MTIRPPCSNSVASPVVRLSVSPIPAVAAAPLSGWTRILPGFALFGVAAMLLCAVVVTAIVAVDGERRGFRSLLAFLEVELPLAVEHLPALGGEEQTAEFLAGNR